jgi:CheY-like chemotaxis protein
MKTTSTQVTALVADDNMEAALTLAAVLELLGHTVRVVRNGRDAVAVAEEVHPRLIFLDLGMPVMDGWESCRRIRAMKWTHQPKIIALTGYGTLEARARSLEAGFDKHCLKPLHLDVLRELVADQGSNCRPMAASFECPAD